jgi:hypothetical protein
MAGGAMIAAVSISVEYRVCVNWPYFDGDERARIF